MVKARLESCSISHLSFSLENEMRFCLKIFGKTIGLKLHSPLTNSRGSSTGAEEPSLGQGSQLKNYVANTNLTQHLAHAFLSLLIAVMSCLQSPKFTGSVES